MAIFKEYNVIMATTFQILTSSQINALSPADQLAYLQEERKLLQARLAQKSQRRVQVKMNEKGTISFHGVGRWPTTLYRSQWLTLIENIGLVQECIDQNKDFLDSVEANKGLKQE
jgi:hypothetical protein